MTAQRALWQRRALNLGPMPFSSSALTTPPHCLSTRMQEKHEDVASKMWPLPRASERGWRRADGKRWFLVEGKKERELQWEDNKTGLESGKKEKGKRNGNSRTRSEGYR